MHERYAKAPIIEIFSDRYKLSKWQETELAVVQARENLGIYPAGTYVRIYEIWKAVEVDLDWWKARDKEIHHDLNAFIDERLRHLPVELQQYVHDKLTSYDTEEPAFV